MTDDSPADASATEAARDVARLLVQSPHRLFFYWSFARDHRPALRAALGEAAGEFRSAVRLVDPAGEWEGEPIALADDERCYWLDALPGRTYRAEAGFHAAGLPFVRVISSNTVETPAAGVSTESDAAPQFQIGEHDFARLLTASGFTRATRRDSSDALASHGHTHADLGLASSNPRSTSPTRRSDNF